MQLTYMLMAWLLKDDRITSVLIGASRPEQIIDLLKGTENTKFGKES